jgi:hypothetical protein
MKILKYLTIVAILLFANVSNAGLIAYDNGNPVYGGIDYLSVSGSIAADDFVLADYNVISDIHWWGAEIDPENISSADNFNIYIFKDNNGTPEINPYVTLNFTPGTFISSSTGNNDLYNTPIYEYSVDISPEVLNFGETYYLSIVNDQIWYWMESDMNESPDNHTYRYESPTIGWGTEPNNLAFNLTTPVPLPPAILLLGTGIISCICARRKKWLN